MSNDPERTAMRWMAILAGLAILFVAATVAFSWWGVAIAAFAWGVNEGRRSQRSGAAPPAAALAAALAGVLAWGGLLIWNATRGPATLLARMLGELAGVPPSIIVLLTLVFVGLLVWSATAVGAFLPTAVNRVASD